MNLRLPHEWEAVKDMPTDSYDFIVFMGDYFDSWENQWPAQGNNFKSICSFVREDRTHRKLLLGNHDWSYLSKTKNGSGVSGHQIDKIDEIRNLLTENHDILDIAFECDGIVFSHAGFSPNFSPNFLYRTFCPIKLAPVLYSHHKILHEQRNG